MNYEKKYKEALELSRVAAFNGHQNLMEGIFPELKESEDEKKRKAILELVRQSSEILGMQNQSNMIAWLKKQDKKKFAWSKNDEYRVEILYALCEEEMNKSSVNSTTFREMQETRNWLHSLKERIRGGL